MHILLGLSSVLLVLLGSYLGLGLLRRLGGWPQRRNLQMFVMAAPIISLGLGLAGLHHFADRTCFLGAPFWDTSIGAALPMGMGLIGLGAFGLGVVRLVLMALVIARRGIPANREIQTLSNTLADRFGTASPRVLICPYTRPLAITYGLRQPVVLLSTWMVEHLDRRELEAVLAHEVGHVARRDYLVIWLATLLRDAFCYLPTSWVAYRQLQHEKELASDDLAVNVTNRPLALASALAKVWHHTTERRSFVPTQSLLGAGMLIESRIERLIAAPRTECSEPNSRLLAFGIGTATLIGILALEALNVIVMLVLMGCGPDSALWKLFS